MESRQGDTRVMNPYEEWQLYGIWRQVNAYELVETEEAKAMVKRKPTLTRLCVKTFFDAIVLCVWTDLMGPRCRQMWLGSDTPEHKFHDELLARLPRLTTSGELNRELHYDGTSAARYYRLPSEGYELGTFVFLAKVDGSVCRCALSLVKRLPSDQLSQYLKLHQVCKERVATLVKKLVASLKHAEEPTSHTLLRFTDELGPFMMAVSHLGLEHAPAFSPLEHRSIEFAETALCVNETQDGFGLPRPLLDICITCHLETAGRSVIVGSDIEQRKKVLKTLALFLTPSEQMTVKYDTQDTFYEPDLLLQAVAPGMSDLESQVLESNHPSTIIDLDAQAVRQTHNRDVYTIEHTQREHAQLTNLENGLHMRLPSGKLSLVRHAAPLVRAMLASLLSQPQSCHEMLLTEFIRSVQRTALVLIEFATGLRATAERPLPAHKLSHIRQALKLSDDHDFEIVLAMCWRLDNESYARIVGDESMRQDQLSSFLDAL
eukprot:m.187099 g.187099  ORF g.187099 m.187099 type:complete len:489 (+) comp16708_c0_seq4:114-1580(+)